MLVPLGIDLFVRARYPGLAADRVGAAGRIVVIVQAGELGRHVGGAPTSA
jgi:hypothetical protein